MTETIQAAPTSKFMVPARKPEWLGRSRWKQMGDSLWRCGPWREKARQAWVIVTGYLGSKEVQRRLERLRDMGYCDVIPTTPQLLLAGRDQIILTAADETMDLYRDMGIPWNFHNFRRFVAQPSSMMDPIGLLSDKKTICHHILQTYHRHPVYDFVLLMAHEGGLDELLRQADLFKQGKHPEQACLETLVEDGNYHEKILKQIEEFARNPKIRAADIPEGTSDDPVTMTGMDQCKDIRGFAAYASRLRVGWWNVFGGVFALVWNGTIGKLIGLKFGPVQLKIEACDPEIVRKYLPDHPSLKRGDEEFGSASGYKGAPESASDSPPM